MTLSLILDSPVANAFVMQLYAFNNTKMRYRYRYQALRRCFKGATVNAGR